MRRISSHPAGAHGRLTQKTVIGPPLLGREGSTQFAQGLPDHCDSSTVCMLCRLEPVWQLSSSSSCHQTCVFHLSTHFFAISLKLLRLSNEQGLARRVHCIMDAVFSVSRPHSTPHFCLCSLLHVDPVRSRFRHLHVVHRLSYPLARLSLRLTVTLCGVCNLLSHSLHRMILGDNSAGFTLRKKQFLDFRLLSAECCPYREWTLLVSCLVFYTLAHTSLRVSGCAIPASKYRSSTLVGLGIL